MSLKDICKPICFLGHGHSLKDFEERISLFKNLDVCWVSLNQHWIAGDILNKIGIGLDMCVLYSKDHHQTPFDGIKLIESKGRGNSLFEFLVQCIEAEVEKVYLFGCDGFSDNGDPYYKGSKRQGHIQAHTRDTEYLNNNFPSERGKTSILNVSMGSHYKQFRKITYEECLSQLSSQRS